MSQHRFLMRREASLLLWLVFLILTGMLSACSGIEGSTDGSSGSGPGLLSEGRADLGSIVGDIGGGTSGIQLSCEEAQFFTLINLYRAANSKNLLQVSLIATTAARWHAQDMGEKGYFSHTDSLGRSPGTRLADYGYRSSVGENIAAGNSSAGATFCQWKNSSGHNQNMLNASYTVLGIGRVVVAESQYQTYWVTPFGYGADQNMTAHPIVAVDKRQTCELPATIPGC